MKNFKRLKRITHFQRRKKNNKINDEQTFERKFQIFHLLSISHMITTALIENVYSIKG